MTDKTELEICEAAIAASELEKDFGNATVERMNFERHFTYQRVKELLLENHRNVDEDTIIDQIERLWPVFRDQLDACCDTSEWTALDDLDELFDDLKNLPPTAHEEMMVKADENDKEFAVYLEHIIRLTKGWDKHPEWWDVYCCCAECRSADPDPSNEPA